MNSVFLIGRMGKDPQKREVNGKVIATFSLATRRNKETTDWHNVTVWGSSAELALKYCAKGSLVAVSGQINYSKKDNTTYTDISCDKIEILSTTKESDAEEEKKTPPPSKEDELLLPF